MHPAIATDLHQSFISPMCAGILIMVADKPTLVRPTRLLDCPTRCSRCRHVEPVQLNFCKQIYDGGGPKVYSRR